MKFYAVYNKGDIPICGTWVNGKDPDDARLNAEYKIMFRYPDIDYDTITITSEEE